MKTFPMFFKVAGKRVVIIGGGEQAAQKSRLMLKTEAELVLVSPTLDAELRDLVDTQRAQWVPGDDPDLFTNIAFVFVATGCKGADASWHARAKAAGAVVNVVDYPELCDAMTPSIVDRDPVVVAIGTEGTAPLLGRQIKTRIEEMLHPRLGVYAALAGRLRSEVAHRVASTSRREFWRWVFGGAPWSLYSSGREREATRQIKDRILSGHTDETGHLCVILGAKDRELVPMAAVQRLQEADMIFIDRGLPETILELARRDAERTWVEQPETTAHFNLAGVLIQTAVSQKVVYLTGQERVLEITSPAGAKIPVQQVFAARFADTDQRSLKPTNAP